MQRNPLSGMGKVYRFSLKQACTAKGWLISTILVAVLLLAGIPLLVMFSTSKTENKSTDTDEDKATIQQVIVCDETEGEVDYSYLTQAGYEEMTYTSATSMDDATAKLTDVNSMAILSITKSDDSYALTVYLGDDSDISRSAGSSFASFVEDNFTYAKVIKSKIDPQALTLLTMPVSTASIELQEESEAEEPDKDFVQEMLEFLVPFLVLMILYMTVLLYGNSMGQSILLEKTSYLMDTMLTSIHPMALIFGKLFAVATSAVIQLFIWMASAVGGCFMSVFFAFRSFPDTTNEVVIGMDTVMKNAEIFSIPGICLSLVIIALGFLLYLSVASVSGSLASKIEDLGKTNYVFVLILIFSFFLCLGSPANSDSMIKTSEWLNYFPFTAILVLPAQLLLGTVSIKKGLLCAFIMLVATCLFVYLAATIYRLLVLYRGNPPTPKALFEMLKGSKKQDKGESSDV